MLGNGTSAGECSSLFFKTITCPLHMQFTCAEVIKDRQMKDVTSLDSSNIKAATAVPKPKSSFQLSDSTFLSLKVEGHIVDLTHVNALSFLLLFAC